MTASMSESAGRAPRSRRASTCTATLLVRGPHLEAQEGLALLLVQAGGDPEVEQGDRAVGLDEEVAAVEVAVEDAVEQGALEEGDEARAQDGGGVDAGRPACPRRRPTGNRAGAP